MLSHIKSFVSFDQRLLIVILPGVVLYYHGVGSLVAETGSCLHEEVVPVVSIVAQQVVLVLEVHILLLYVSILYLL